MRQLTMIVTAILICAPFGAAQDDDRKIKFNLKDASVNALIEFLRDETKWIIVETDDAKKVISRKRPKITATSDTEIPLSQVQEFVDTALKPHGLATLRIKNVLVIATEREAKDKTHVIRVGSDPKDIEISDKIITQIMPLKNISVQQVNKEMGDIVKSAGKTSYNSHANVIIVSGRSQDIHRLAKIISEVDAQVTEKLQVKVIALKNADATEAAQILNEVFKKESGGRSGGNFFSNMMRMFGGGRRGRRNQVSPASIAGQIVRITADTRTNSLIITASEDNIKLVEEVVAKLDGEFAAAIRVKMYTLRHADANEVSRVITEVFSPDSSRNQSRGGNPWMRMMGLGRGGQTGPKRHQVKAVAETRTNAVVVTAHESEFKLIDDLVFELDRQITDVVKVVIYKLKNAEADDMTKILQDLFRQQIQGSQNTNRGRNQGGRNNRFMRMLFGGGNRSSGSGSRPPSQEVEITADIRTNSVIAKASEEYQTVIKNVIRELDSDATETKMTYTIPLKNASADKIATVLRDLFRGSSGGRSNRSNNRGLFNFNNSNTRTNNRSTRSSNRGSSFGGRRRGNRLGPLNNRQDNFQDFFQDEDPQERRSVEGDFDVQADPDSNTIVIRTSPRNFDAIQRIVSDLDRMRPQVLIKVLIVEVTLTNDLQFGVEGFWENKMTVRGGDRATNRFGTDFGLPTTGFSYLLSGDEFEASVKMLAKDGRLTVLATPRILVLDNQTANINIGKEIPIVTNSQVTQNGNTINTIQYESVGILLEVTPHVNPDGLVTMVIHPEISDVASAAEAVEITEGVTNPTFIVNSADTTVTVRTGTTVVIGGLIRETTDVSVEKVPILGDIPLIGLLFSNTKKRKVRRELMIFLTPYVAFTATQLEEITELEKSKLRLIDEKMIDAEANYWLDRIRDHVPVKKSR